MGMFSKKKRKERRQERKERRKTRVKNATGFVRDAADTVATKVERVVDNGVDLKAREERLVRVRERVLVIYSEFGEHREDPFLRRVYGFVEQQGISLPSAILSQSYARILPCVGMHATLEGLEDVLRDALADPAVDEVDLLWHGHGTERDNGSHGFSMPRLPGKDETFDDKNFAMQSVDVTTIGDMVENLDADDRLRMFYTTACYGAYLAEELVESGFSCGAGALKINTNSTLEFPIFLKNWAAFLPFGVALADAFRRSHWRKTDTGLKLLARDKERFGEADSTKRHVGDRTTNIRTNADF